MRIRFAIAALLCALWTLGCTKGRTGLPVPAGGRPSGNIVATLDTEEFDHKAGEVVAETMVQHQFVVRNRTVRTLHVRSLRASGKSTTAKMDPMQLGPGDKAVLTVSTQIPEGPGGATVELQTDGGVLAPRFTLNAIGVRPRVSPTALHFGRVLPRETKTHDLKVLWRNSIDLVPREASEMQVHPLDPRVSVGSGLKLEPKLGVSVEGTSFIERLAGWSFPVTIRCVKPEGMLETTLEVVFVKMPGTVLKVPVRADLVGPVRAVPPRASFFLIGEKTRWERKLQVFCDGARPLQITRCRSLDERIQVAVASRETKRVEIELKLAAEHDGEEFETEIVLDTGQPEQPELRIPVQVLRVSLPQ